MTADFQRATARAAAWTREALRLAPDADAHPGVVGHLTAARSQHWAVEQLMTERPGIEPGEPSGSRP